MTSPLGTEVQPPRQAGVYRINGVAGASTHARPWTVNLTSWVGQQAAALVQCRVIVTFSGGDAAGSSREVVEVDYPAAGSVFTVHASDIRVEFSGAVSQADLNGQRVPPLLGAWLTAARSAQRQLSATLTELVRVVPAGGATIFNIPPRARAFRLFSLDVDAVSFDYSQFSNNASPVTVDVGQPTQPSAALVKYNLLPSNRSAWFPVAPEAATINFNNLSGASTGQIRPQWLLELG